MFRHSHVLIPFCLMSVSHQTEPGAGMQGVLDYERGASPGKPTWGWNRIGRRGRDLREGLVWLYWEALESKSLHSKVVLPEAGARLLSRRREVTGKRHWEEDGLLPSRLCQQL